MNIVLKKDTNEFSRIVEASYNESQLIHEIDEDILRVVRVSKGEFHFDKNFNISLKIAFKSNFSLDLS